MCRRKNKQDGFHGGDARLRRILPAARRIFGAPHFDQVGVGNALSGVVVVGDLDIACPVPSARGTGRQSQSHGNSHRASKFVEGLVLLQALAADVVDAPPDRRGSFHPIAREDVIGTPRRVLNQGA